MMSELGDEDATGSYSIYFAEGDALAKQKQFQKAIETLTKAMDFKPEDRPCLVERSKCYLQLGDTTAALADAEASLKEDKTYHRGLYQKAETMYAMGDFEYALMFYHRGDKIRPDIKAFKLGIQKAQEAINNSIGSPAACKLDKTGDLSFFQQQNMIGKKRGKRRAKAAAAIQQKTMGERKPVASDKAVKDILGELYVDREYLNNLMKDPGLIVSGGDRSLFTTVDEALGYLDARTEFWRQQKPMYARKRERELKKYRPPPTRPLSKPGPGGRSTGRGGVDHTKFVLKTLDEIDAAMTNGEAETSLQKAQQLMKTVQDLSTTDLPNKLEFLASLHSSTGNAYLEMGEADLALEQHTEDLKISEELGQIDGQSRALDNVGRTYCVLGDFKMAIEFFQKKLPLLKTPEETTWLYHELGRCQLELNEHQAARELGEKSLTAAREAQDHMWQLNASVLIAQAESKLGELAPALQSFERSLELAKLLEDTESQTIIKKAMEEINSRIVEEMKPDEGDAPAS